MRIDEICDIQSGYTARGRLEPHPFGTPALQLRDLGADEAWDSIQPEAYNLGKVKERYFAGAGDVLFRSRGANNTASAIPEDWPHLAVAVLPLMLLKPRKELVQSEYLAWAISQKSAQVHFRREGQGGSIHMVPKSVLASLEIELPDLKSQALIIEVHSLAEQAYRLDRKAADLRHHLNTLRLRKIVKSTSSQSNAGAHA